MAAATLHNMDSYPSIEQDLSGVFLDLAVRALVIDDNSVNIRLLSQQLRYLGCQIDSANSGAAGLELWALHRYSFIFVDCHMPHMDGRQVIARLRASRQYQQNVHNLFAFSADASAQTKHDYLDIGADYFVSKPIEIQDLYQLLQRCFELDDRPNEMALCTKNLGASLVADLSSGITDTATSQVPVVNITYLDKIFGGDSTKQQTQQHLVSLFLQQAPFEFSAMSLANAQHNSAELGRLAHKLKSSAASVGAQRMVAACIALEKVLPNYHYAEVALILSKFDGLLHEFESYWASA